jgi:hypothetical protein
MSSPISVESSKLEALREHLRSCRPQDIEATLIIIIFIVSNIDKRNRLQYEVLVACAQIRNEVK